MARRRQKWDTINGTRPIRLMLGKKGRVPFIGRGPFLLLLMFVLWAFGAFAASQEEVDRMVENLHWLGHASFRMDASKTIYFDPWKLSKGAKMADMIFVTHEHFDHLSIDDIKRIATKDTTIVCDRESGKKIGAKVACKELKIVSPGDRLDIGGVGVEATAAY